MGRGYWGYYEPTRPIEVKDGIKAKSKRGKIGETWWSERWIKVLESFNMGARLSRGRSYARKGQVISIDVKSGAVTAKVQGSRRKPYSVDIRIKILSKEEWDKVTTAMASKAIFAAKLLSGEMPKNIEDVFAEVDVPLFPASKKELVTECSCPDSANPCKHIAAVYYLLAERFDEDPFLIFNLRGQKKEHIIETLRKKRARTSVEKISTSDAHTWEEAPLENCLETFWEAGIDLETFSVSFERNEVDNAVLKILGEAPFKIRKKKVSELLERAYEAASKDALEKALSEENSGLGYEKRLKD